MTGCKPLALWLALVLPGAALAETVTFDVAVAGVQAGSLSVEAKTDGAAYAARIVIESSGMVRLLRRVRYESASEGSYRKGRYVPTRYTESADSGQRRSEVRLTYAKGVPQIEAYAPAPDPEASVVDPAALGGTLDPATALFAALRDVAPGAACTLQARTFDGRRLAQFTLGGAPVSADGLTCQGEYRRLQGYTPTEMADKQRFAFTLIYAPAADGQLRVVEVTLDTVFGKARLTRR